VIAEIGGPCLLRDGSMVEIRQVECGDAALLADGFARLSVRSRRLRFMRDKNRLTEAELRYLTCVDHHDHEALGALGPDGRGVGVARYIRDSEEPRAAELAITVVDEWQGRGLGSKLLELLRERALTEGIYWFTAQVAYDNHVSSRLVRNAGGVIVSERQGVREYEIWLVPQHEQDLARWLRQLESADHGRPGARGRKKAWLWQTPAQPADIC
jgi:GNAT superfamily N-acetyltransferase